MPLKREILLGYDLVLGLVVIVSIWAMPNLYRLGKASEAILAVSGNMGKRLMANQKILIVDDEKNIRLTTAQALQPLGYGLETAVNGEDALKQLEADDFGLILLDLKMPGMDGLAVLRRVVELRPDIRVILISAHGTVEHAVEAMRLGAVDFIQKPFVPNEI